MIEKILATDGYSALLIDGKVATIAFLQKGKSKDSEGNISDVQVVELDVHQNGKKDYFFFEEGKLANCCIDEGGDLYMLKIYDELIKAKECSLNNFLVVITASFTAYMIGGIET